MARGQRARSVPLRQPQGDTVLWGLLFLVTLVSYWPTLQGAMLWDDAGHVTRSDLQTWHGLWRIWFDVGATQQYYPLLHSAFWVEHRLWGDAVLGYHLVNVALHVVSAALVVLIVRRLSLPGAWLAGFVFAVHPVQVETVAWIAEQKTTLSGVFCLAAALAYLGWHQKRQTSHYVMASMLFALALLSKSVTATLPAVLLVVIWWQRGRLEWKRDWLPLLPWLAAGMTSGLFTAWLERTVIGAAGAEFALTPMQRVLLAGRVVFFYAGKVVWPGNLIFSYPRWEIDPAVWWQYLFPAGVLVIGAALATLAYRNRAPLAAFLVFTGMLFPVLGFLNVFPFRYSWVADHFLYLASLGMIVPLASWLTAAAGRFSVSRTIRVAAAAGLTVVLGFATSQQSSLYTDDETLFRETVARNPDSFLAHINLGTILEKFPSRLPEAIDEFRSAVRLKPNDPEAHYNLGNAIEQFDPDRLPEIIREYETAIRLKNGYAEAHNALGNLLLRLPDRLPDAISECEAAIRIRPDYPEAHNNLGNAFSRTPGRLADAINEYRICLRLDPSLAQVHANLGQALMAANQLTGGIAELESAVRLRPDSAELHYNLGSALPRLPGRLPEAINELQAAVRLRPDLIQGHFNLAMLLVQTPGRAPEAIQELEEAQRLRPDFEPARQALAQLRRGH